MLHAYGYVRLGGAEVISIFHVGGVLDYQLSGFLKYQLYSSIQGV